MSKVWRKLATHTAVALLSFALIATPALAAVESANSQDYSAEAMIADAVFFRPLGLLSTVCGGAVLILTLPFSLPGGNAGQVAEKLVGEPFRYTFSRPLGDID